MSSPSSAVLIRRLEAQMRGGGPDVRLATEMLRLIDHDPDAKRALSNWLLCKLGIQAKYNVLQAKYNVQRCAMTSLLQRGGGGAVC
jgi:hypothetical protein